MPLVVAGDLADSAGTEIPIQGALLTEEGGFFLSELGGRILLEEDSQPDPPDNTRAESYIYVFEADKYWSDRNDAFWAGLTVAAKEAALRQATARLDASKCWAGQITRQDQRLAFPRFGCCDKEGRIISHLKIPYAIKHALAELAYQAALGNLDRAVLPINLGADGANIKKESIAGALEVEYHKPEDMNKAAAQQMVPDFPWIDQILEYSGLVKETGGGTWMTYDRT